MPAFPTLTPVARSWTPGDYGNAASVGISGKQVNVRTSNAIKNSELQLQFVALTQAELNSIAQHYIGQQGSYQPFGLVYENWIGVSNPNDYILSGYLWRYAEPPKVEDYPADGQTRFSVSIKLVTVVGEGSQPILSIPTGPPSSGFSVSDGNAALILGDAAASSPSGWAQIHSGYGDDDFVQTGNFGFTFGLNNQTYTSCFVGSNGYATFGAGSTEYDPITYQNPALPKLLFAPGDRSYVAVYTKTFTVSTFPCFGIRWEGAGQYSITAANTFIEFYFVKTDSNQYIDVRFGALNSDWSGTDNLLVATENTALATATRTANTSFVFTGNPSGTTWTVQSGKHLNIS